MIQSSKLQDAFDCLVSELKAIDTSDSSVKARRQQTAESVHRVNAFLRSMNVDRSLRAPLMRLVNSLSDADSGISSDILRPETMDLKQGRIPETEIQHKAALSVAMTLLKSDAHWKIDDAAKYAAKAIDMDPKALITFRKNVCSRRGSAIALERYEDLLRIARRQLGTAEERAKIIIEGVRAEWSQIVQ